MTNQTALTAQSQNLFNELVGRAADWSGTPLYNETERTQVENGNLTDLKVKGLVTTFTEDGCIWVQFTDEGIERSGKTSDELGIY